MGLFVVGALARHRYWAGMLNGLPNLIILLTVLFVPAQALPGWIRGASMAFGTTWVLEAARAPTGAAGLRMLGASAVVTSVWVVLGVVYLWRIEAALRRSPGAHHQ
jgi:hypothetical protein